MYSPEYVCGFCHGSTPLNLSLSVSEESELGSAIASDYAQRNQPEMYSGEYSPPATNSLARQTEELKKESVPLAVSMALMHHPTDQAPGDPSAPRAARWLIALYTMRLS